MKYPQYFTPEIKQFIEKEKFSSHNIYDDWFTENEWVEEVTEELPDNFYELRKMAKMRVTSAS